MNESFQKMSLVDSNYLGLTEREIEKEALQSLVDPCIRSHKQPNEPRLSKPNHNGRLVIEDYPILPISFCKTS